MAASLMTLTGQPKALRKSNPIQPLPRLCGSRRGHPLMIGPGKPNDTQSNFQSRTKFLTTRTIFRGVMVGPDGHFRGSFCPVASTLMFVPPMSMTRTLRPLECFILFATDSLPRKTASLVRGSRRHSCDKLKAELPAIILFRRGGRTPWYIPLSVWAVKEYWMKRPTRASSPEPDAYRLDCVRTGMATTEQVSDSRDRIEASYLAEHRSDDGCTSRRDLVGDSRNSTVQRLVYSRRKIRCTGERGT